jgi:outer membrane protein TolC
MNQKLLYILICTLTLLNAKAQKKKSEEYKFTLQQATDFAIVNNRNAKNAGRNVLAAEKQKWETIAVGLPQINASAGYENNLELRKSVLPANIFDPSADPDLLIPVEFGVKHNVNATASINQLIFDGSYLVGLQSVKVFLDISKLAKEKTDLEVRKNVIKTYTNVLFASESITILENNKRVLEENRSETKSIYENGLAELEALEQLEITLASITSSLNRAKRFEVIAYEMLNVTLGIDLEEKVEIIDTLDNLVMRSNSKKINDSNIINNVDLRIAENDRISKELLVKLAKSEALPKLGAYLNAGYLGFGKEFEFFQPDQNWFGFASVGVSTNIPIFSSLKRSAGTQRAKINSSIANEQYLDMEQNIKLQLETARNEYQFSVEDLEIKRKNLKLAERIENKNQVKFFEGIGSSLDLRQAQNQLYSTQNDLLQAKINVINKKAEIETILNTTN